MMLVAMTALSLAFQATEDVLPYAPTVSILRVRATAAGVVTCTSTKDGIEREDPGCDFAADAPSHLRRLHRDAELIAIIAFTPEGQAAPSAPADAGELLGEGRARLVLAPDGRITHCEQTVLRLVRRFGGMQGPEDLCSVYRLGQREFAASEGTSPRSVELSALMYLRESPPR